MNVYENHLYSFLFCFYNEMWCRGILHLITRKFSFFLPYLARKRSVRQIRIQWIWPYRNPIFRESGLIWRSLWMSCLHLLHAFSWNPKIWPYPISFENKPSHLMFMNHLHVFILSQCCQNKKKNNPWERYWKVMLSHSIYSSVAARFRNT